MKENEVKQLLGKQAAWQKNRAKLSWPEKIRLAEAVQGTLKTFQQTKGSPTPPQAGQR